MGEPEQSERTMEDYTTGFRLLMNARKYLEKRHPRSIYWITDEQMILSRAMADVADAMQALRRKERNR